MKEPIVRRTGAVASRERPVALERVLPHRPGDQCEESKRGWLSRFPQFNRKIRQLELNRLRIDGDDLATDAAIEIDHQWGS